MIYRVRHRTTYVYGSLVSFSRCVLRLTPRTNPTQTLLEHQLLVTPAPAEMRRRIGPFDEEVTTFTIETTHRRLEVEAVSRVDVHTAPPPAATPAWEAVRGAAFAVGALGSESPAHYLYPTQRTPILSEITDYARSSFSPGRPIVEAAAELTRRIHADFAYDNKATSIATSPGEAFAGRRGVCQDFTNIMIAGLRGLSLPAAYVSGYLRTTPPPGEPRLEGADATHAWVRLWCGADVGWVGFDPTNALVVGNDHITLAIGRDYADVAPIEGVMLASGDQTLKVEVDVIPETSPATAGEGEPRQKTG